MRLKKGPEQKPGPVFAFVATVAVDVVVAAVGDVVVLGDVQPVAESVGRSRIFSSIGIGVVPILEKFKFSKSQTFFATFPILALNSDVVCPKAQLAFKPTSVS